MEIPDYDLPPGAIAQKPIEPRDAARLLVALDSDGRVLHRQVADLPDLLGPGDVLVVNTTRVMPARLRLRKRSGGAAEVLLLQSMDQSLDRSIDREPAGGAGPAAGAATGGGPRAATGRGTAWTALVRPGRRLPPGTVLFAGDRPVVEVGDRLEDGCRRVTLLTEEAGVADLLDQIGVVAVPPYVRVPLADPERYQTVYADRPGSVAAPTAGLHLTRPVLERCAARGCRLATVELEIGLATFQPVTTAHAEDHVMHRERYRVPPETLAACRDARRVVAVGTTTVRALETAAATARPHGDTDLYIYGRYPFEVVDVLLTNFHQPRSSLLLLLDAFCGPRWRELYELALQEGYRFLSLGDAMVVGRRAAA